MTTNDPIDAEGGGAKRKRPLPVLSSDTPFKHRNLPDQLADHIVLLLAKGELKPGQRLFENEICKLLGVSRIPVREALRLLQAQGVVKTEPNRGSFMNSYGSEEANEFLKIRLNVEQIALKRLVRVLKTRPEVLDTPAEIIQKMRQAHTIGDKLASCQADLAFHSALIELSGSPVLLPIWHSISRGILVYFMQERQAYYDYDRSILDHEVLLDAIKAGETADLDGLIERHIMASPSQEPMVKAAETAPAAGRKRPTRPVRSA